MAKPSITDDQIRAENEKLKLIGNPVRIKRNHGYLVLRAQLPPKPGESGPRQRRELSLGISATQSGLRRAVRAAKVLEVELNEGRFDWSKYDRRKPLEPEAEGASGLITRFKQVKMRKAGKRACSEATWQNHWMAVYKKLPQDEPLSEASVLAVLLSSEPDTRGREQHIEKLQALCRFAGLTFDFDPYLADYEPAPRELPPDSLIEEWHAQIADPGWRWIYGIMATFGVRPHESLFCDVVDVDVLQVHKGKTGPRISAAIRPEWVEQWELQDKPVLPIVAPVEREDFKACGAAVYQQLVTRLKMPFDPYDLRHAWAIRASVVEKLPVSTAADFMGHSPATHTKIYHRWLSRETNLAVYRKIVRGFTHPDA